MIYFDMMICDSSCRYGMMRHAQTCHDMMRHEQRRRYDICCELIRCMNIYIYSTCASVYIENRGRWLRLREGCRYWLSFRDHLWPCKYQRYLFRKYMIMSYIIMTNQYARSCCWNSWANHKVFPYIILNVIYIYRSTVCIWYQKNSTRHHIPW